VYLPRVECESSPAPSAPEQRAPDRPLRILLVEDNESVRRIIVRVLERASHVVIEAATAADALEAAVDDSIDVVLLDQSLPDQRGLAIVPDLRSRSQRAKILLFTGEDVTDADLARVDGLVTKPVTGASLLETLARKLADGPA